MQARVKYIIKKSPFMYTLLLNLRALFSSALIRYHQIGSKKRWQSLLHNNEIKLNLGSGQSKGSNGWITVDQNKSDINWDLRKGIPLPDCSVNQIYAEHLLEHIPYKELLIFVSECQRVLIEDGEFKIVVPDASLYINAYNKKQYFRSKESLNDNYHKVDTGSYLDQVNFIAYMGNEHKYMFDEENLKNLCLRSGFKDALLVEFDINMDSKSRHFESLYIKAIK